MGDIGLSDAEAMGCRAGYGLLGEVNGPIEIDILSGDLLPICLSGGVVWKRHEVPRCSRDDKGGEMRMWGTLKSFCDGLLTIAAAVA